MQVPHLPPGQISFLNLARCLTLFQNPSSQYSCSGPHKRKRENQAHTQKAYNTRLTSSHSGYLYNLPIFPSRADSDPSLGVIPTCRPMGFEYRAEFIDLFDPKGGAPISCLLRAETGRSFLAEPNPCPSGTAVGTFFCWDCKQSKISHVS